MDKYTEIYNKYRKAIFIQQNYNKKSIMNDYIKCSTCKNMISYNGVNSHSRIHGDIVVDKFNYLSDKFNYYERSVYSNKIIKYSNILRKNKYIVVCNSKEYQEIINYVTLYEREYKKCLICGDNFISKRKTCSDECLRKMLSIKTKEYWCNSDNLESIIIRNSKISEKAKIYNIGRIPWNKGLVGEEYISHYDKPDGSNSMIDAFKKSSFIPSSSIEIKLESFLKEYNFRFHKSWFCSSKQFDFLISFNYNVLIVECDGDYWHKSKRRCLCKNERNIKRNEDKLKENIIYENIKKNG